ncbi:MAG: GEVED domain-containing protein [Planctomycetota bacterium]
MLPLFRILSLAAMVVAALPAQIGCPSYCRPSSIECCSNTGTPKEHITGVQFANLLVTTDYGGVCPGLGGYIDYTARAATVGLGNAYQLNVTVLVPRVSLCATNVPLARAWIDWNGDGVFNADPSEEYDLQLLAPYRVTITVPANAVERTRMRVGVAWPGRPGSCNTNQNGGSFQDFTVLVPGGAPIGLYRYGSGLAGTSGVPEIGANGTASPGNAGFAVQLDAATPHSPAFLAAGLAPGSAPLFGGTLQLDPAQVLDVFGSVSDAGGGAAVALPIPPAPSLVCTSFFFQWLVADAGAVQGYAMSGGLEVVIR